MLNWKVNDGLAYAGTPLVQMTITVDWSRMTNTTRYYEAEVAARGDTIARAQYSLPSMEAAQAWCQEKYRALLQDELAALP